MSKNADLVSPKKKRRTICHELVDPEPLVDSDNQERQFGTQLSDVVVFSDAVKVLGTGVGYNRVDDRECYI